METIYADIAGRTGGNIYIGVSGPVRTGKSTLVKRIMEMLVIPNIQDPYQRERAKDELPQSGSGRTIMTSEPKFVPEEAVEISPDGTAKLRVRMIDSVGYMVNGAVGAEEDGVPRMVTTPWCDREIPLTEAAELGTKKVMQEHCSIGLVVTTDGTVTDIPREDYLSAEAQSIRDMQKTGKPFLVIVNSRDPGAQAAADTCRYIAGQYGVEPALVNAQALTKEALNLLLQKLLYTFPMTQLEVQLPGWLRSPEPQHPVKEALYQALLQLAGEIRTLADAESVLQQLTTISQVQDVDVCDVDLGTGTVRCRLRFTEALFYELLSSSAGIPIRDDNQLLTLLTELAAVKREYDRIADALSAVNATGYGIVMPSAEQLKLETPEILRKNGAFGIKLRAGAPSIHMLRVDIDTQLTPMVGDEKQSRELVAQLSEAEPETLWQSNIFGKSVHDMIQEGISAKLLGTSQEVREKFRGTLTRIVNEGASGLVCLIL